MRLILITTLSVALAHSSPAAQRFIPRVAPSPNESERASWEAVMSLPEGALVEVRNRSGAVVEGNIRAVSEDKMALNTVGAPIEVLRTSIGRVVLLGARTTRKNVRRGFIIGAAVGATHGALTADANRGTWMVLLAAIEGAVGAAIGAIHGAGSRERTVIYEATS